eukprot:TRINITY_DN8925_c0_g1_i1.p1 TRINITY_DN8925_c0_g1~~TRINITY_DN8925_c0_g1_i1.p1  ORF type:complete len:459 (+),score=64.31 TRINITY_DN8925_c0_g1_i1:20-1396(+)
MRSIGNIRQYTIIMILFCLMIGCNGYIRDIEIQSDSRAHFFISSFGFFINGHLSINVDQLSVEGDDKSIEGIGFLVKVSKSDQSTYLETKGHSCALTRNPKEMELRVNVTQVPFLYDIDVPTEGSYNIFFINCKQKPVTFKMTLTEYNVKPYKIDNKVVKYYLPAGQERMPYILIVFVVLFVAALVVWVVKAMRVDEPSSNTVEMTVIKDHQSDTPKTPNDDDIVELHPSGDTSTSSYYKLNRMHYLMTALLISKILATFSKAVEFHFLSTTGTASGWNIPYYFFAFCKGIILFTVIGLIGTGYTFFKHYLTERDRKIFVIVIPLQIIANVAQIETTEGSLGSISSKTAAAIFQVVDILCCIAIIVPIAMTINHLKEASASDGKAASMMEKLVVFRQFYLLVLGYLYFTRIIVFFTTLTLPFNWEWLNFVLDESATLAFFVIVGYKFRPQDYVPSSDK